MSLQYFKEIFFIKMSFYLFIAILCAKILLCDVGLSLACCVAKFKAKTSFANDPAAIKMLFQNGSKYTQKKFQSNAYI
jgi:hypothetical protein